MTEHSRFSRVSVLAAASLLALALGRPLFAHCDTLSGPVVADARSALESGDVTPALKWVRSQDEAEIRRAFDQAVRVRSLGAEARELADRSFFETLVRVHRAGEGAPFTGLKSGEELDPSVAAADSALASGSAENLVQLLSTKAAAGVRERFLKAREARSEASKSVAAGRRYVAAYVEYVHYVERLANDAAGLETRGATEPAGHDHSE